MKRENLNERDLKIYDTKLKVLEEKLNKESERYLYYDHVFDKREIDKDVRAIQNEIIELKKLYGIECDARKNVYSIKHGRIVRNEDYF